MLRFFNGAFLFLFLAGRAFSQDTVSVAPGIVHIKINRPGPQSVNVVVIDLSNPSYHIVSYKASRLIPSSLQVRELSASERMVLAAVNGDFFSFETMWPVGNQVENGALVHGTKNHQWRSREFPV